MKNIFVLMMLACLAACSSAGDIRITSRPVEIDIARTADPNGVQMLPVNFRVVTRETLSSFMEELSRTQGNASPVFIAMTARDYENMSLNLSDLRRYIEQQQAVIVYYRQMTARLPPGNQ